MNVTIHDSKGKSFARFELIPCLVDAHGVCVSTDGSDKTAPEITINLTRNDLVQLLAMIDAEADADKRVQDAAWDAAEEAEYEAAQTAKADLEAVLERQIQALPTADWEAVAAAWSDHQEHRFPWPAWMFEAEKVRRAVLPRQNTKR
jgi:hypothetical protein